MEQGMDWEQRSLFNEITRGRDLAKQLQKHLHTSSSTEMRLLLVEKIICSYKKALSMLMNSTSFSKTKLSSIGMLESPPSAANSTEAASNKKDISNKKRKTISSWTEHVKVCSGSMEGPPEDEHCWRKYGQKNIVGAKFPRGHYRCTHRMTRQLIFGVRYVGTHACKQSSHLVTVVATVEAASKEKPKQSEEVGLGNGTGTKVKTEELDSKDEIFRLFSLPYASVESEEGRNNIFSESMVEYNKMGRFSPSFISPATSESNYFSMSPSRRGSFGIGQTLKYDLTQTVSEPASVTNSPIEDLDFSVEFVTNFSLNYFS
ncbi:hypothetical protein SLA2020_512270 [Shorea laevis]